MILKNQKIIFKDFAVLYTSVMHLINEKLFSYFEFRYRSIQQRRALKARLSAMEENKDNPNLANMLSADLPDFSLVTKENLPHDDVDKEKTDKEKLEDMENELANESGNESDETQAPGQISDNEVITSA